MLISHVNLNSVDGDLGDKKATMCLITSYKFTGTYKTFLTLQTITSHLVGSLCSSHDLNYTNIHMSNFKFELKCKDTHTHILSTV